MSLQKEENVLKIPIKQITNWKWDIRRDKEDAEELEELAENIRHNGLINAITVIPEGNKFRCIAGRRRLAACKSLGMDTITAFVNTELAEDADIKIITSSENIIRKNCNDTEEAYYLLDIYQSYGYTPIQAIKGVKWMHNNKEQVKQMLLGSSPQMAKNERLNTRNDLGDSFIPDRRFIEIAKKISKAPNTQYQYLQWVIQLEQKILELADKNGLDTFKKILLTSYPLRNHPVLQRDIINEIRDYSRDVAQSRVQEVCELIENGTYERLEDGTYIIHDGKGDKKTKKDEQVIKPPSLRVLELHSALKKTLFQMTDHRLAPREHMYKPETIQYTKNYREELVAGLDDNALTQLRHHLKLVKTATDELLDLVRSEYITREQK